MKGLGLILVKGSVLMKNELEWVVLEQLCLVVVKDLDFKMVKEWSLMVVELVAVMLFYESCEECL